MPKQRGWGRGHNNLIKTPEAVHEGIQSTRTVTLDPFTVLPKEIYREIFNKLDNPTDKQSFINTHPEWHSLFESSRTTFLFENVLNILTRYEHLATSIVDEDGDYEQLYQMDFLNLRIVCREWDKSVQNYIQLHPNNFQFKYGETVYFSNVTLKYQIGLNMTLALGKAMTWENTAELEADMGHYETSHPPFLPRNSFLSRKLILNDANLDCPCCSEEEADMEAVHGWWAQVGQLLEAYGEHIWHCEIQMKWKLTRETYTTLLKWLGSMPNLKTLHLECSGEHEEALTRKEVRELSNLHAVQLKLDDLQLLKAINFPPFACNYLFAGTIALQMIQIELASGKGAVLRNYAIETLPSAVLKEALITIKGADDLKNLQRLKPFPVLTKLIITLAFENEQEILNKAYSKWPAWYVIWKILEEKCPALEELDLRLPKALKSVDQKRAIEQSLNFRLNLLKLKKLRIVIPNLSSIDFLLPLKALKELRIILEHSDWNDRVLRRRETIQFNRDFRTMWNSNIWQEFPALSKLHIKAIGKESGDLDEYEYDKKEKKYSDIIRPVGSLSIPAVWNRFLPLI